MSLELWLSVVVLLAIAFLIILPPLLRTKPLLKSDVAEQNILIAQQKLEELKTQLQAGTIDQAQYESQELELESALNDDLSLSPSDKTVEHQGRWVIAVIVGLMPIFVIGMYQTLGDPEALTRPIAAPIAKQQINSVDEMVASLEARMRDNPNDVQGWVMLGRSYKYLKQYENSVQAYQKAYQLNDQDPELMLQYADALVMAKRGKFDDQSQSLIFKALKLDPENNTALWLAGIYKAETGELVAGVEYLAKARSQFPPGSESYNELNQYISSIIEHMPEADKQQVKEVVEVQQVAQQEPGDFAELQVRVELSESLAKLADPEDIVFIYAKALSGPQMPLAIVRKQVKDLPLEVTLSDQQAMSPMMKLSKFKEVELTARISKSGQAMQQSGDLIGSLKPVSVADTKTQSLTINRVVGQNTVTSQASQQKATKPIPPALGAASIKVSVDLSPQLRSQAQDSDTVFIYAKAISGPPMPLSIVRKQVKDLPLQIELTDAQAMSPAMKLSGFDKVTLVARVSKTGQAMQGAGDMVTSLNNIPVRGGPPLQLTIDQLVK